MPIYIRMNGKWKEVEQPYVKVNGQIKETEVYTKVAGKPRLVFGRVTAKDIYGFRMVYYAKKDAANPDLPQLKYNPDLPVIMSTSEGADRMNVYEKGVIYQYFDTDVDQEGILMYEGRLLAMLRNGMLMDIFGNPDPIPGLNAPLVTKSMDFTLMVTYNVRYQGYGIHTRGWNSMWTSSQFLKADTADAQFFKEDVRQTIDHLLVPVGESDACREMRELGLKDLSYERALSLVYEALDLPEDTKRDEYAAKAYPYADIQCPGRVNDYISYARCMEIWEVVQANKEIEYSDGLFDSICSAIGVSREDNVDCSIYGQCKLGFISYRAACGEPECHELQEHRWPSMSLLHASDLWHYAQVNRGSFSPQHVADDLFGGEERYCPGRPNTPLGYPMASLMFNAVMSRMDKPFTNHTVVDIMDELGLVNEADGSCTIYGKCLYPELSYSQCLYFRSCDEARTDTDITVIPDDTSSVCEIGISRDMHTAEHHMQGSRGALSQTLHSISLDGATMPFTVQIVHDD